MDGLMGNARRVSAHIGNQAHWLSRAKFEALVKLLGDCHGPLGRKSQPADRLLLEFAGRKWRGGISPLCFLDNLLYPEIGFFKVFKDDVSGFFVWNAKLLVMFFDELGKIMVAADIQDLLNFHRSRDVVRKIIDSGASTLPV